jgi:hypothetical protein
MRRVVLCEGPSDITALREIGISLFGAKVLGNRPMAGAAGEPRKLFLAVQGNGVEITAVECAKSGLPEALATKLLGLPVEDRASDPNALERITVLFDPDDESPDKMYARLADQVSAEAKAWKLEGKPGDWVVRRNSSESITLRAVPWRSPGDVVDGLPDCQNLERLICHIAASAYPEQAKIVERWLGEIPFAGNKPSWKAALHLWCALVEPKADESNAAAKFLHQNATCQPHVSAALEQVSLFKDLSLALGFSVSATG